MRRNRFNFYAPIAKQVKGSHGTTPKHLAPAPRTSAAEEPDIIPWPRYRSILVPLDGSTFAEHAIPYAVGLAEQSGAALKLVHVHLAFGAMHDFRPLYFDDATVHSLKRRKESYLTEVIDRVSDVSSVRVSSSIVTGHDVSDSLRDVNLLNADLVVMATHGRGVVGRLWWGSVVHHMLRQIELPVMLIRGDNAAVDFTANRTRHILIPLDGTSIAEQILEPVVTLGAIVGAKHTLMQVVRLEPKHLIRHGSLHTDWVPSKDGEAKALRYLEAVAQALRGRSLNVQTRVVSSDERIASIISLEAEHSRTDLIAVSSTARGAISRIFRHGTRNWLIRNARIPLFVVPTRQRWSF
jgi:nucleotide-binding universal stress UspA family protein